MLKIQHPKLQKTSENTSQRGAVYRSRTLLMKGFGKIGLSKEIYNNPGQQADCARTCRFHNESYI